MRVDSHVEGPRLYLIGLRVHHGMSGTALAALGIAMVVFGVALAIHDRSDFPWLRDG